MRRPPNNSSLACVHTVTGLTNWGSLWLWTMSNSLHFPIQPYIPSQNTHALPSTDPLHPNQHTHVHLQWYTHHLSTHSSLHLHTHTVTHTHSDTLTHTHTHTHTQSDTLAHMAFTYAVIRWICDDCVLWIHSASACQVHQHTCRQWQAGPAGDSHLPMPGPRPWAGWKRSSPQASVRGERREDGRQPCRWSRPHRRDRAGPPLGPLLTPPHRLSPAWGRWWRPWSTPCTTGTHTTRGQPPPAKKGFVTYHTHPMHTWGKEKVLQLTNTVVDRRGL